MKYLPTFCYFQGKICSSDLYIRSTFQRAIRLTNIDFPVNGLSFKDLNPNGSLIAGNEVVTKVGRIYFEPNKLCEDVCYIPLDERNMQVAFPKKTNPNNNKHFDELELRKRTEAFRQLKWRFQSNYYMTLNTKEMRQFQLHFIIDVEWPKLVLNQPTNMLPIEIGKRQEITVTITNPSNNPVVFDYYLSNPAYAKETQLSLPVEVVDISSHCYLTNKNVFSLAKPAPSKRIRLPPHSSWPVKINFEANEPDTYCTLLHIRNNLTLYEAVWISGKAVQSQFRFGNRKPGSSTPLLFEVTEKHLSQCTLVQESLNNPTHKNKLQLEPIIIRRTFTARNSGELPIRINTFLIGDEKCEGYGFKVIDCQPFVLPANTSRKIEVAFSPDFTVSRLSRYLTLKTNLSYEINYILVGQLPAGSLRVCGDLMPRPYWENGSRYVAIIMLLITLGCAIIAAHIDYGNVIMAQSAIYMSREKGPVHATFNLRNIGLRSSTEEATATAVNQQDDTNLPQNHVTSSSWTTNTMPVVINDDPLIAMTRTAKSTTANNLPSRTTATQQQINSNSNGNNLKKRWIKNRNANNNNGEHNRNSGSDETLNLKQNSIKSHNKITFSEHKYKQKVNENVALHTKNETKENEREKEKEKAEKHKNREAYNKEESKKSPPNIKNSKKNGKHSSLSSAEESNKINNVAAAKAEKNQICIKTKSEAKTKQEIQTITKSKTEKDKEKDKDKDKENSPKPKPEICSSSKPNYDSSSPSPPIEKVLLCKQFSTPPPVSSNEQQAPVKKIGKTPGRERKSKEIQQQQQNENQSCGYSSSSLSSSSSSCSSSNNSNAAATSKRNERKLKSKTVQRILNMPITMSLTSNNTPPSTPTSPQQDIFANNEFIAPPPPPPPTATRSILSPWESSNHVSFSDVLQSQLANINNNNAAITQPSTSNPTSHTNMNTINSSNNEEDILIHTKSASNNVLDMSAAAVSEPLKEQLSKKNSMELGPIGSRKSPSSQQLWGDSSVISSAGMVTPAKPLAMNNMGMQQAASAGIVDNNSFFSSVAPAPEPFIGELELNYLNSLLKQQTVDTHTSVTL